MDCPHCEEEMELEDREAGDELYVCTNDACRFLADNHDAYYFWYTREDRILDAELDKADEAYERNRDE